MNLERTIANILPKKIVHYACLRAWNHAENSIYPEPCAGKITFENVVLSWECNLEDN